MFKLYHCKRYFKRYKFNINNLWNFDQKCILCDDSIETPSHLFEKCAMGVKLREKRDFILNKLNYNNANYNFIISTRYNNTLLQPVIIQYTALEYKKIFDSGYIASIDDAMFNFLNRIKVKFFCDHRNYCLRKFQEIWDPNNSQCLLTIYESRIFSWNLQ